MKRTGEKAIQEIIDKVRSGEYLMYGESKTPLRRWTPNPDFPGHGSWTTHMIYSRQTIAAAQRRMTYRFDHKLLRGVYEVSA